MNDIDQLRSLRRTGKQRVSLVLDRGIFNLLWWDPQHLVCPDKKKNTKNLVA